MQVFSKNQIDKIINEVKIQNEDLDIFAGPSNDRRVIVKNGLKIRHKPSGLVYTVLKLAKSKKDGLCIICSRPGKKIIIPEKDFNHYERQ